METKEELELMNLKRGTQLRCLYGSLSSNDVKPNHKYKLIGYVTTSIPKNNYSATMSWYPDKPIWSDEEYEEIRYKFMMIRLEGIEKPQWLRDFVLA